MTRLRALVVAAVLAAAAYVVVTPVAPASAAACSGATGVTVVADFNGLGGGVQGACVADGGGDRASDLFAAAGFALNQQTPGNPGYVCQVGGKPAGCGRPDGDAYWGLWWSDGRSGSWTYSSLGVSSLKVPEGGYVAFAWDDVAGDEKPSYAPAPHTATPSPTPQPSPQPVPSQQPVPSEQPTSPQAPSATPSDSAGPTDGPASTAPSDGASTPTETTTPTATPSAAPTTATPSPSPSDAPASQAPNEAETALADPVAPTSGEAAAGEGDGLPGWLAPLVIVLLLAIAGVVALLKRRQPLP